MVGVMNTQPCMMRTPMSTQSHRVEASATTGQKTENTENKEQREYPLQKKMDKIMDLGILPSYDTPTM